MKCVASWFLGAATVACYFLALIHWDWCKETWPNLFLVPAILGTVAAVVFVFVYGMEE